MQLFWPSIIPDRVWALLPSATRHTKTVPSFPAEASKVPSGENATDCTVASNCGFGTWWPVRVRRSMPSAARQSLIVPSLPPDATIEPSAEYWTAMIEWACPPRIQNTSGRSACADAMGVSSHATLRHAIQRPRRDDFTEAPLTRRRGDVERNNNNRCRTR